jgi:hypothetical protein
MLLLHFGRRKSGATATRYRIEREASEERVWQQLVNIFRRLAGFRIDRTGQQAYDAEAVRS